MLVIRTSPFAFLGIFSLYLENVIFSYWRDMLKIKYKSFCTLFTPGSYNWALSKIRTSIGYELLKNLDSFYGELTHRNLNNALFGLIQVSGQ